MSIYSDNLAHVQVVINCQYSIAQMCTCEDTLAHYLGPPFIDDVMIHNTLITPCKMVSEYPMYDITPFLLYNTTMCIV